MVIVSRVRHFIIFLSDQSFNKTGSRPKIWQNSKTLEIKGKHQHGFKRNKSTTTAGALLQSVISRAADDKCYVVTASLDLSMAFDMVNT